MADQQAKKIVWIKCRAHADDRCSGNQAEVVFERANNPVTQSGGFEPNAGGRSIRYKCLTCSRTFHISN